MRPPFGKRIRDACLTELPVGLMESLLFGGVPKWAN